MRVVGVAAVVLAACALLAVRVVEVRRARRRALGAVPDRVQEPPTADDPAVVAVLWGYGAPSIDAVAGTLLALARRRSVRIEELDSERLRVVVPVATTASNESERIVLAALRACADQHGVVTGPPLLPPGTRWWRHLRRDAVRRARSAGLVQRVLPAAPLVVACTAGAAAVLLGASAPAIAATALAGAGAGWILGRFGGMTLTPAGYRLRALWAAFARHLGGDADLARAGPASVEQRGRDVVYGAVLDVAPEVTARLGLRRT